MACYQGVLTQGGADTFTAATIPTGLTVDGKAGWSISGIEVFWSNGYTAAAADALAFGVLATVATTTLFNSLDEIARVGWGVQNTAGVAVAMSFDPIRRVFLSENRLTVQPNVYFHCNTLTTGLTNVMYYKIYYDIVKLTDMEVIRLFAGGA
jgi:hypothetical protein